MRAITSLAVAAILGLAACGPAASTTPSTAPSPAPSAPTSLAPTGPAGSQSALVLHTSIPDGCDAIGVEYHRMTFHFDVAASEQVWAVTDTGALLRTGWSPEFRPDPVTGKAILDPGGRVVASDGEVFVLPVAGWPRLHGYFVCLGPESALVWFADPEGI